MTPQPSVGSNPSRYTLANGLTLLRLLLALPTALALEQGMPWFAAGGFVIAATTDYFDGRIARQRQQSSAFGAIFDHATDALYVTCVLVAATALALVPPLLPALIPVAFLQYLLDSRALAGQPLRANWLGRWNGVGYFVLGGVAIGLQALATVVPLPPGLWLGLWAAGAALCLTTLLSMANRALHWWQLRRRSRTPPA